MARLLRASFPRLELLEIGEKGFIVTSSLFCPRHFRFDVMELAVVIPFIETVQLRRFLHFARHADDVVVFDPNLIVLLLVRFDELLVLLEPLDLGIGIPWPRGLAKLGFHFADKGGKLPEHQV